MAGAILETWVFAEILKSYWHNGKAVSLYFYRDRDQREIDLLIEANGQLHPVEFKKSASPSINAVKKFSALTPLKQPIGPGAVLCLKETDVPLARDVSAIPIGYL
jgi:predicted AAA+ superfamily ATPase